MAFAGEEVDSAAVKDSVAVGEVSLPAYYADSVMYANRASTDDETARKLEEKFQQRQIWVLPEGRDRKSPSCYMLNRECVHYMYEKPETGTGFFQQSYDKDWYEEHHLRCVQD